MKLWLLLIVTCGLLSATGCGPSVADEPAPGVPVSGKILSASGAPLKGGTLILWPIGSMHSASATIQPDGSFTMKDQFGREAMPPGTYKVYVKSGSVPAKYQDIDDGESDVTVQIQEANSALSIRLKT